MCKYSLLQPLAAVVLVSVLHFLYSRHQILGQFKVRLAFTLQSTSIHHFCGNHVGIVFTENKMKQKESDEESAKAVRKQMFLSRYKSELGIVESSVSKSSAYCHYYYH